MLRVVLVACLAGMIVANGSSSPFRISSSAKPVQLVRPSAEHDSLEVVEAGMRWLEGQPAVQVLGVVGQYHSGKSFLVDALVDAPSGAGFVVGATVEPTTLGLWTLSEAASLNVTGGEAVRVLLLDTEGFAAPNVSVAYDAKVFALTSLLSSYILMNSIRIIDQQAVDHLELLTQRTRLFSQLTNPQEQLFSFPPLMWVVQNFLQDHVVGENATTWLRRLLRANRADSAEHPGLGALFASADCATLFVPATSPAALRKLDAIPSSQWTEQYRDGMAALRQRVAAELVSPGARARARTGPQLATAVRTLVAAANNDSVASIPSLWETFVMAHAATASARALELFDSVLSGHVATLTVANSGGAGGAVHTLNETAVFDEPVAVTAYQTALSVARNASLSIYDSLIVGLPVSTARSSFVEAVNERSARMAARHRDSSVRWCSRVLSGAVESLRGSLSAIELPMSLTSLQAAVQTATKSARDQYRAAISAHACAVDAADSGGSEAALELVAARKLQEGSAAIAEVLRTAGQAADDAALAVFHQNSTARTPACALPACTNGTAEDMSARLMSVAELEQLSSKATAAALTAFDSRAAVVLTEPEAKVARQAAEHRARSDIAQAFAKDNDERLKAYGDALVTSLTEETKRGFMEVRLPQSPAALESLYSARLRAATAAFRESFGKFSGHPLHASLFAELSRRQAEAFESMKARHNSAWLELFEAPLMRAKTKVMSVASEHWLPLLLRRRALAIAEDEIRTSLAASKMPIAASNDVIDAVLRDWVAQPDMEKIVRSVWLEQTFVMAIGATAFAISMLFMCGSPRRS